MRTKVQRVSTAATGVGPWIPVDHRQNPFSVAFDVDIAGNTGTYTVQHGYTDWVSYPCSYTRVTTTMTVTQVNHGLAAGDSVNIMGSGLAANDGYFAVATVSSVDVFTLTLPADAGPASGQINIQKIRVMDHATIATQTTSKDGNYAYPINALRLKITVSGAGSYYMTVNQGSN